MALRSAEVPTLLEPGGLLPGDARMSDGATMIPWNHGRCLAWDTTCPDTVAPSHLSSSTIVAGLVTGEAEAFKSEKYSDLVPSHVFVPVDIETLGVWGPGAMSLFAEIGRRLVVSLLDLRSCLFLGINKNEDPITKPPIFFLSQQKETSHLDPTHPESQCPPGRKHVMEPSQNTSQT